jgi:hypothetical protein
MMIIFMIIQKPNHEKEEEAWVRREMRGGSLGEEEAWVRRERRGGSLICNT